MGNLRTLANRPPTLPDFSEDNEIALCSLLWGFLPRSILEIGVFNPKAERGSTSVFMEYLSVEREARYVGVDIIDRGMFQTHRVAMVQGDSMDPSNVQKGMERIGVKEFDMVYIDGNHSVVHVMNDFKYSELLSERGCVVLHDSHYHPGPVHLVMALDRMDQWSVRQLCQDESDWGMAVATRNP